MICCLNWKLKDGQAFSSEEGRDGTVGRWSGVRQGVKAWSTLDSAPASAHCGSCAAAGGPEWRVEAGDRAGRRVRNLCEESVCWVDSHGLYLVGNGRLWKRKRRA